LNCVYVPKDKEPEPCVYIPEKTPDSCIYVPESKQPESCVYVPEKKEITKKKKQIKRVKQEEPKLELNFENAALKNVLDFISNAFDVRFFPDDAIIDERKLKGVGDIKINFKSNKPFSLQEAWNFLDLVLNTAGLSRVKMPGIEGMYRITLIEIANKSNIPGFIGTDPKLLPDYERIRYLYFVKNKQVTQIRDLLAKLQSKNALLDIYQDLNAIIMTDNSYNIKALMQIVQELDAAELPEMLSILKLKSADASDVVKLYESLKGKEDVFRPFQETKKSGLHFTQDLRVIAEPRTNALIIFGPKDSVKKLEDFIKNHVDRTLESQPSKIHVYELNYAPAEQIANILNTVTQFGADSDAARFGGIRGGEKYLSRLYFEPEKQGNRLIVRGDHEDYKLVKPIIAELDQQQPQVAIEVFIVTINMTNTKGFGSQIRNKTDETVDFQTSGFSGNSIQVNPTTGSLVTNLINLATAAVQGSTVISLGKGSVWGIFSILSQISDSKIIANPFLVATNKYTATVSLGETRRIITGTIVGASNQTTEQGNMDANLTVSITPQINDFGIVNLDIDVTIDNFTNDNANSVSFGNKDTRKVHTNANVADKEVLALGGLIRNRSEVQRSGVPILSSIPLLGLLFTNKRNVIIKDNLVIFMSPTIIRPHKELVSPYTQNKAELVRLTLDDIDSRTNKRDPVYKWLFNEPQAKSHEVVDDFIPVDEPENPTDKIGVKKVVAAPRRRSLLDCTRKNREADPC